MIPEIRLQEGRSESSQTRQEAIIGSVAESLDTEWLSSRANGRTQKFLHHLVTEVAYDRLPPFFHQARGVRKPAFPEAVRETTRRLQFLEQFGVALPATVEGALCGGSMSYGRFYNVHSGTSPSDIDFLLVVDPAFFSRPKDIEVAVSTTTGFQHEDAMLFQARCARFTDLYRQGAAHIMSHKFSVEDYLFSLKVIPLPVFMWEFEDLPKGMMAVRDDRQVAVLDYKQAPYAEKDSPRKNFYNDTFVFHGQEITLPFNEVVTQVPAAVFHEGAFYTGDHHNHLLPKQEILFDRDGRVQKTLNTFHELLKYEFDLSKQNTNNGHTADAAHIMDRSLYFSPQRLEEARKVFS